MFSGLSSVAIPLASISEWTEGILIETTPLLIYTTLFLFVFIETGILIAFFLPGDSVLFAAGFIAASREDTSITILVTVIFLAAFLGDQVGFVLGRHFGRPYLERADDGSAFRQSPVVFAGQLTRPLHLRADGPAGVAAGPWPARSRRAGSGRGGSDARG